MSQLPAEILEKASVIAQLAESTNPEVVAQLLAPWMREDPDAFAQVTLALAQMADKDKWLKAGHAAYVSGERGKAVEDLERTYQRKSKARVREYARLKEQAELNEEIAA